MHVTNKHYILVRLSHVGKVSQSDSKTYNETLLAIATLIKANMDLNQESTQTQLTVHYKT